MIAKLICECKVIVNYISDRQIHMTIYILSSIKIAFLGNLQS